MMNTNSQSESPKKSSIPVVRIAAILAFVGAGAFYGMQQLNAPQEMAQEAIDPTRIETIFMPLERETIQIPTSASGTGGGLTEWAGEAVLVTNAGEFYSVDGGAATRLDITPPENGINEYAAFLENGDGREPALYWFRFNDVLIDPRLGNRIFVSFTRWKSDQNCYTNAIASASIGATPGPLQSEWETLFEASPCLSIAPVGRPLQGHMAGARMTVTDDGELILASGDYARDGIYDETIVAQDQNAEFGKIISINPTTGASRIISSGHSNTQGVTVDDDGNIWNVEHGRRGGDELNLIREGRNYGWPATSLGTRYNKLTLPTVEENGVHSAGYEAPVRAWLPSVAPSSLTLIEGFDPLWDGDLLMGTLSGESLYRIRIRDGRVLFDEHIPVGQRVRYVQMMSDGRIALYTDAKTVEFLTVGQSNFAYELAELYASNITDNTMRSNFLAKIDDCTMCHSLGQITGEGPRALGRVIDHPFSSGIANRYSGNDDKVWNRQMLTAYLSDPQAFAPGTTMPDPQLSDEDLRNHVVNFLAVLSRNPE